MGIGIRCTLDSFRILYEKHYQSFKGETKMPKNLKLILLLFIITSCGGNGNGGSQVCPASGIGTLEIVVNGLPGNALANVKVVGPNINQILTGSDTLSNLATGEHTITAEYVSAPHSIVRTAYSPTVNSPVCVKDGEVATANVNYAAVPSSNKLWVSGNSGSNKLRAIVANDLNITSTVTPSVVLTTKPSVTAPDTVTFDKKGNLWVIDTAGFLKRFPANQLTTGEKAYDVIISGNALSAGVPGPNSMAFDANGNLWVSVTFSDKVLKYNANQLSTSGSPNPSIEIKTPGTPSGLAFDVSGNLWVTITDNDRTVRYDASRLTSSTDAAPDLSIEAKTPGPVINTLSTPSGLAFDANGNLWVAYFGPNIIAQLTPNDLMGTGSKTLTPEVQVTLTVTALLTDLVFDESGHLWTAYSQGKLGRLSPTQLNTSGTKTPEVVITSSSIDLMSHAEGLAFYPAPANLPLYHDLP